MTEPGPVSNQPIIDAWRRLVKAWEPPLLDLPPTLTAEDRDWVRRMLAAAGITAPRRALTTAMVPLSGASLNAGWRGHARGASREAPPT